MSRLLEGVFASAADDSYLISRSLRFAKERSVYYTRTPNAAGNRKTWTFSCWFKKTKQGNDGYDPIFWAGTTINNNDLMGIYFLPEGRIQLAGATGFCVTTSSYKDNSSWYHLVVAFDSTQALNDNRAKIYVNGIEVPQTRQTITQNADFGFNAAVQHEIGRQTNASTRYFSGYLAEMHFIDGQALPPTAFGRTNNVLGAGWEPIEYKGSYGGNGFYIKGENSELASNAFPYSEDLSQSVWNIGASTKTSNVISAPDGSITADKFSEDGTVNQHIIQHNFSGTSILGDIWTFSSYVKAAERTTISLTMHGESYPVFNLSNGTVSNVGGSCISARMIDVGNGWYRCFATFQRTNTQNSAYFVMWNGTNVYQGVNGSGVYLWGMQMEKSSTSDTYVKTGASAVSNTVALGRDYSRNGGGFNTWTAWNTEINITSPNFTQMRDTPTPRVIPGSANSIGNYPTMNSSRDIISNLSFTNADLQVNYTGTATYPNIYATLPFTIGGKYYLEVSPTRLAAACLIATDYSLGPGAANTGYYQNGTRLGGAAFGASYTVGDIIGVAVDTIAGSVSYYKNNVLQGTQTYFQAAEQVFMLQLFNSDVWVNFGQRPFAYTPPSGFVGLNNATMSQPTVSNPRQYFDLKLYNGNGLNIPNAQTISGYEFSPDLIWIKGVTSATNHHVQDIVRGPLSYLLTNAANGEQNTGTGDISSFNSDGFTLSYQNDRTNQSGVSYVAWAWNCGDTNVTNSNGTISSTVRANQNAGQSIISYTGNGVAGATVGHGLGRTPNMVIIKNRTSTASWPVFVNGITTQSSGSTLTSTIVDLGSKTGGVGALNLDAAWGSYGMDGQTNASGNNYIAYAFAQIPGYSKFGTFIGNGSADGPFIYTGFKPAFIMIKATNSVGAWNIMDKLRLGYNDSNSVLYPHVNAASQGYTPIVITANGFKLISTNTGSGAFNSSGTTFFYMAFADTPLINSLAR